MKITVKDALATMGPGSTAWRVADGIIPSTQDERAELYLLCMSKEKDYIGIRRPTGEGNRIMSDGIIFNSRRARK